jgi:serine/threonine-protein kinase
MTASGDDGFAVRGWLATFEDASVERDYVAWELEQSLAWTRTGLWAALFSWVLASCAVVVASPHAWLGALFSAWCVIGPLLGAGLALARGRGHPRLTTVVALVTAASGLLIARLADFIGMADLALPIVCIVAFFGYAIFRLRPGLATAAVAASVVPCGIWLVRQTALGEVSVARCVVEELILLVSLQSGLLANLTADRASRRAFRQERVIERQRATIERQQALLEKELSHQVAERSRELGNVLARSDVTLDARSLKAGERFAERYDVIASLGAGGMGAVYEVQRVTDSARLALKAVVGEVSGASAARFAREAEIGARVRHPNLVSIVDVGVASGVPYLVMEMVKGGSLEAKRSLFGDVAWALPILRQIADGLAALHDAGVVHRDLKPANVLLDGSIAKISDFGISRFGSIDTAPNALAPTIAATPRQSAELTGTGVVMGTPLYMAPEAAKSARQLDASADVFAFGIIAYEMLTGRSPFAVPAFVLAMADQPIAPPPLDDPRASEKFRELVRRALSADPTKRPRVRDVASGLS